MVGRTKRASFKGIHGSLVGYKSCPDPELAGLEYIFALVMDQTIKDYIAARKIRYQYEFGDEKDQMRLQRKKRNCRQCLLRDQDVLPFGLLQRTLRSGRSEAVEIHGRYAGVDAGTEFW